ncbi:MAG: GlmU family protein [Saprospiraceae bacterium]|nr:GlmU family protein [Saprospiraceae bacterium]MCZ2338843.1 GlmU family protein [Chitinophagales bacterium]
MSGNIILFDHYHWTDLLPLTFTRPVSELRIGILTIKEKWERYLQQQVSYMTEPYLAEKYPTQLGDENIFINSSILPDPQIVASVQSLHSGCYIECEGQIIAASLPRDIAASISFWSEITALIKDTATKVDIHFNSQFIRRPYDIFVLNGIALLQDFELVTKDRKSAPISSSNQVFGKYPVFAEEGVRMECCIINTTDGPVYLGKDVEIMEGTMIRGGFAAGEGSIVKMGAKIYGPTTIGPNCRLGGEVNNAVMIANSNKGHDGFLGNSVIGEWCNLGADTNNSNLKNNYLPVKIWSYTHATFKDSGLQFCGLIMGDHSKSGINTMFNTGTVVGVACNIFGDGFPRTYIPSFSWGGAAGFTTHQLNKVIETAEIVMKRRHMLLTETDKNMLREIFIRTFPGL